MKIAGTPISHCSGIDVARLLTPSSVVCHENSPEKNMNKDRVTKSSFCTVVLWENGTIRAFSDVGSRTWRSKERDVEEQKPETRKRFTVLPRKIARLAMRNELGYFFSSGWIFNYSSGYACDRHTGGSFIKSFENREIVVAAALWIFLN